jgi:gamma-glutamyltranspeptidase / glutathione hydrolase
MESVRGSRRSMVLGRGGMVATSQPLASFAGAEMLRGGGNAVDAAIAAAGVLAVVEPYNTGLGGDCFMLVWSAADRHLYALDGSGAAPAGATIDTYAARGLTTMPMFGILAVTVPGAVDAWATALDRFGTRPLAQALAPAIVYAEEGFAVSEVVAAEWAFSAGLLQSDDGRRLYAPGEAAPRLGDVVRLPDLARTLHTVANGGRGAFYEGEIAERIGAFAAHAGGMLTRDDLAQHRSCWREPIAVDYRGHRLYEVPPPSQGILALLALRIREHFEPATDDPALSTHLAIGAVKIALADRPRVADPQHAEVPVDALLSREYAATRAALLRPDTVRGSEAAGTTGRGDTVALVTADGAGNVVAMLNSLYYPFGSGLVVDGTGIVLQNRGFSFSLDPTQPNALAPRKRPFHTLAPAMLCKDGAPLVAFGIMGGNLQAQAHVQVVTRLIDGGCNVQEALDAPRFHVLEDGSVALERAFGDDVARELTRRGHLVRDELAAMPYGGFGGGQAIMIDAASATYWGASDSRKDGCAIGF